MKLLDQCRHVMRLKHYSYRTEQSYVAWIERFIRHHGIRHPGEMGAAEIEQFFDLFDRSDVRTTMIYTHVMEKAASRVRSPLDAVM